ncbi:hypothetical protein DSM106972_098880 [Dulcicalothrix desertica PCC 7102]|uniref:DUF2141 domain-containing protein n=1 Tax=Dulcicalothrix desertica PCC 7102 TaxID=232991 RepID=A0A3S1CHC4_9CYAN|nr:DUF2141 domain-containing protein [Dulcicalothrix desertica]RUS92484.1 hypothetical protein DSM106972_098880 [Dulcicalothrix desertica PCC 7102]TWH42575.1 uncharacterized protein (DUF2141 family) [Dulcicalothrix desertica PCC 7102]
MKFKFSGVILVLSTIANLALLSHQAGASFNGKLNVRIDGLKSQKGQVCLTVFSTSRGFPDNGKRALSAQCTKIGGTPQTVTFPNLKPGNYAIAVIHDTNGDGALNRNLIGIPTEGFGFSNNPTIRTGPPKFGESAVLVAGPNTNIQIQLQYFLGS